MKNAKEHYAAIHTATDLDQLADALTAADKWCDKTGVRFDDYFRADDLPTFSDYRVDDGEVVSWDEWRALYYRGGKWVTDSRDDVGARFRVAVDADRRAFDVIHRSPDGSEDSLNASGEPLRTVDDVAEFIREVVSLARVPSRHRQAIADQIIDAALRPAVVDLAKGAVK